MVFSRSGGRNAAGPNLEADLKQQAKWLSLCQDWEVGGQGVKVGRQRSSPWPGGYVPRFLPGSREDGRQNANCDWGSQDRKAEREAGFLSSSLSLSHTLSLTLSCGHRGRGRSRGWGQGRGRGKVSFFIRYLGRRRAACSCAPR